MRIHFVGIGGEGMCGVAKVALIQGHMVSGSEIILKRQLVELERLGAKIYSIHSPAHVNGVDLVVHSSGIPATHVEVATALSLGIDVVKRSRALGMLLCDVNSQTVSVTGSHGKSTTTTMIGRILENATKDPTVVVGAYVPYFNSHARVGKGKFAVVEACEFDRSFLDIESDIGVITGIKPDHLDYYREGLPEIIAAFCQFAELVRARNGLIVACADDETISEQFFPVYRGRIVTYGLKVGDWRAQLLSACNTAYQFSVFKEGRMFGEFSIGVPGKHNVQNALAAIVVADALGISADLMRPALLGYTGIHRRYEKRYISDFVIVIDDYAHSPYEIEAVLSATRQEFPEAYIVCVLCLRQFHRTYQRLSEFSNALLGTDICVVCPIVAGLGDTEATKRLITSEVVAHAILEVGCRAIGFSNENDVIIYLMDIVNKVKKKQHVLLTVGSGITENILNAVCERLLSDGS